MRLLILSFFVLGFFSATAQKKITGFLRDNSAAQYELEKKFDGLLNAADQDKWMKFLTSKPHHIGSAHGKANAEYMADLFRQWGYETEIAVYHVLFQRQNLDHWSCWAQSHIRQSLKNRL